MNYLYHYMAKHPWSSCLTILIIYTLFHTHGEISVDHIDSWPCSVFSKNIEPWQLCSETHCMSLHKMFKCEVELA